MQAEVNYRPRVSVAALGCKLSQAEGDAMAELLLEAGFCLKPFGDSVDVAIVHTCTVTETAGAKSRKLLSKARRSAESRNRCRMPRGAGWGGYAESRAGRSHRPPPG